ncbi:putative glycerophosphocholine phosphodiesterase GPCPD1 2 [Nymphon striatum]|nr:putative glycerophosphocholine phosphodiesterase GPCPD1 2 [Nymphon striatum]
MMNNCTDGGSITFNVNVEVETTEVVKVVGNCAELGNWNPVEAISLTQDSNDKTLWSCSIKVSSTNVIYYRYLTCIVFERDGVKNSLLQKWENHKTPRTFKSNSSGNDVFGLICNEYLINHGFATAQTFLFLKFKQKSVQLWMDEVESELRLKALCVDSSFKKTNPGKESASVAVIQAAIIQIDLYMDIRGQSPKYIGFFHLMPENYKANNGKFTGPVYSPNNSVIGKITEISLENSYSCEWSSNKTLMIGHRGSGVSSGVRKCYPPVEENTIASFQLAHKNGFDFVEFDVQLSKDMVPLIYHDYTIGLGLNEEKETRGTLEVHVMDLKAEQLQSYPVRFFQMIFQIYLCDFTQLYLTNTKPLNMASRDIRTFFGQGGGDDEKKESERAKKQIEKRKADQKSYDKAKRRRLIQESLKDLAVLNDLPNHICSHTAICTRHMRDVTTSTVKMLSSYLCAYHITLNQEKLSTLITGDFNAKVSTNRHTKLTKVEVLNQVTGRDHRMSIAEFKFSAITLELMKRRNDRIDREYWRSGREDGTSDVERFWDDLNVFIDTILTCVMKSAGNRRIIFSCFNPEVCTMLKLKQNVYPVALLICGKADCYQPYDDDRTISIQKAVYFALNTNLQGIVAHADEILKDISIVKHVHQSNLLLLTWGENVNNDEAVSTLRKYHLDGIIQDRFVAVVKSSPQLDLCFNEDLYT